MSMQYTKEFDRKLRCDDIPASYQYNSLYFFEGAQPKVRHYDRRTVRNYPNQMMANISKDEETNIRQYMNDKIGYDEIKYQTYRNVVDHQQKIDQAFQNSQVFGSTAQRQTLKAMHQNIQKNLMQNESKLMNIVDHKVQIEDNNQPQNQIQINNQNSLLYNNDYEKLNTLQGLEDNATLSQSKVMETPPRANNNKKQEQQDFYNIDDNYYGGSSGQKALKQHSVQSLPQQTQKIIPQRSDSMNKIGQISFQQNQIDGNGSKLLRNAYGDNVYLNHYSEERQKTNASVDRYANDFYNKPYYSDNINEKKGFNQVSQQSQQQLQGRYRQDGNIFINRESSQQFPQIQPFNLQNQINQRQQNQKQRQRILSYNIITNNSINYNYSKQPLQDQINQLPQINGQYQNNQSLSIDRYGQYEKLQNHPQQDNSQFTINYNLPAPQQISQNPFRPENISEKKAQFNRKKHLVY